MEIFIIEAIEFSQPPFGKRILRRARHSELKPVMSVSQRIEREGIWGDSFNLHSRFRRQARNDGCRYQPIIRSPPIAVNGRPF